MSTRPRSGKRIDPQSELPLATTSVETGLSSPIMMPTVDEDVDVDDAGNDVRSPSTVELVAESTVNVVDGDPAGNCCVVDETLTVAAVGSADDVVALVGIGNVVDVASTSPRIVAAQMSVNDEDGGAVRPWPHTQPST